MTDTQNQNPDQATPPQDDRPTLSQHKQSVCKKLNQIFTTPLMNERLMKMAGGDASRIAKNLTAFLSLITEDKGSGKPPKFLAECSLTSLTICFLESMNMQLPFDSRNLVALKIYDYEAELDISYKGFVNALNRHYKNAFVECKLVFEGDIFESEICDRVAKYTFKPKDPFAIVKPDFSGIRGGYCFFSYTDTDGQTTSRLVFLSITQILANRQRARSKNVWDSDPKAMGEKTCIREGSKLPFAAIDLDVDLEEVDNRHYELEQSDSSSRLKLLMQAQEEVVNGEKPSDGSKEPDKKQPGDDVVSIEGQAPQANALQTDTSLSQEILPPETTKINDETGASPDLSISPVGTIIEGESSVAVETAGANNQQAWDGKSVYTGDNKHAMIDFDNSLQALEYVTSIMKRRKTQKTRLDIIKGNSLLIAQLIRDKHGNAVAELHKLASQGDK